MNNVIIFYLAEYFSGEQERQSEVSHQTIDAVIIGASSVPLASPESPSDINDDPEAILMSGRGGGGEAPACPTEALSLQTTPDTDDSSTSNMVRVDRGNDIIILKFKLFLTFQFLNFFKQKFETENY